MSKKRNYIGEKGDLKDEVTSGKKKTNIWRIVGIGAGVAFVGVLIWALTK